MELPQLHFFQVKYRSRLGNRTSFRIFCRMYPHPIVVSLSHAFCSMAIGCLPAPEMLF